MDGDRNNLASSGITENRFGIASISLGIGSALLFVLVFYQWEHFIDKWLTLVPSALAVSLGVVGIIEGRREGLRTGMAVTGLSLGLVTFGIIAFWFYLIPGTLD